MIYSTQFSWAIRKNYGNGIIRTIGHTDTKEDAQDYVKSMIRPEFYEIKKVTIIERDYEMGDGQEEEK